MAADAIPKSRTSRLQVLHAELGSAAVPFVPLHPMTVSHDTHLQGRIVDEAVDAPLAMTWDEAVGPQPVAAVHHMKDGHIYTGYTGC